MKFLFFLISIVYNKSIINKNEVSIENGKSNKNVLNEEMILEFQNIIENFNDMYSKIDLKNINNNKILYDEFKNEELKKFIDGLKYKIKIFDYNNNLIEKNFIEVLYSFSIFYSNKLHQYMIIKWELEKNIENNLKTCNELEKLFNKLKELIGKFNKNISLFLYKLKYKINITKENSKSFNLYNGSFFFKWNIKNL